MELVQFKSKYQLNKYSKIYHRIYIEFGTAGAISVNREEGSGKIICRSFLPSQVEENTFGIREGCLFSENDTSFNLGDPNALELIKNNFLNYAGNPFFKEDLAIYHEMVKKLDQAYENHFYKIKGISAIYSNPSFHRDISLLKEEVLHIQFLFEEILKGPDTPEPEIAEGTAPYEVPTPKTRTMLICTDAGFFKNITTGMIYEIVKADYSYYKIKDDFGVEHEFKKNRFKEIEVEEMA